MLSRQDTGRESVKESDGNLKDSDSMLSDWCVS